MRKIKYGISIALMLCSVAWYGCKDNGPTVTEVTTQQLTSHPWKVSVVTVDAVDKTSLFTNMTLTFTASGYTTTNGGPVWPASGTWKFVDGAARKIIRNDDLEITITEITDTSLKFSLTWNANTFGSGRTSSVAGNHLFTLTK